MIFYNFLAKNVELFAIYGVSLFYIISTAAKSFSTIKIVILNTIFVSILFFILFLKDKSSPFSNYNIFAVIYLILMITTTYFSVSFLTYFLKKLIKIEKLSDKKSEKDEEEITDKKEKTENNEKDIKEYINIEDSAKNETQKDNILYTINPNDIKEIILENNENILHALRKEISNINKHSISLDDLKKLENNQNIQTERHIALEKKILDLRDDVQGFVNRITKLIELLTTSGTKKMNSTEDI